MADLPVRAVGDRLVSDGTVNGQSVGFMHPGRQSFLAHTLHVSRK
jgi:hypothetical protein